MDQRRYEIRQFLKKALDQPMVRPNVETMRDRILEAALTDSCVRYHLMFGPQLCVRNSSQ